MYTFSLVFEYVYKCRHMWVHTYVFICTYTRPGRPASFCTNSVWIPRISSINFNFQGWLMTISQQRNYLSCNSRHQGPSSLSLELLGFHTAFLLQKKRTENSKTERHKETRSYCRRHRQHSKTEKTLFLELEDYLEMGGLFLEGHWPKRQRTQEALRAPRRGKTFKYLLSFRDVFIIFLDFQSTKQRWL